MKSSNIRIPSLYEPTFKILFCCLGAVGIAKLAAGILYLGATNNDLRLDRTFRMLGPVTENARHIVERLCQFF